MLPRPVLLATTLARQLVPFDSANSFDLEDPISLARLDEPMTALAQCDRRWWIWSWIACR